MKVTNQTSTSVDFEVRSAPFSAELLDAYCAAGWPGTVSTGLAGSDILALRAAAHARWTTMKLPSMEDQIRALLAASVSAEEVGPDAVPQFLALWQAEIGARGLE